MLFFRRVREWRGAWRFGVALLLGLPLVTCATADTTRFFTKADQYDINEARTRHHNAAGTMALDVFRLGQGAFAQGDLASAHRLWNQAARLRPDWDLPFVQLALLHPLYDNDLLATVAELTRAVTINPDNPRSHLYLGIAYAQKGDTARAEAELRETVRLRPDYTEARLRLANLLRDQKKQAEAIAEYEALYAANPHEAFVQNALAALYEDSGRLREAETLYLRLLATQRDTAYAYYKLAQFYERHGRHAEAQNAFARAESLSPRTERRKLRPLLPSRR